MENTYNKDIDKDRPIFLRYYRLKPKYVVELSALLNRIGFLGQNFDPVPPENYLTRPRTVPLKYVFSDYRSSKSEMKVPTYRVNMF